MTPYLGDFAEDETVYITFNTFDSNDPAASVTITNLADADIKVHKDGSATQIVTDGATVAIDFDSITGNHLITIDTSAHTDYSIGSDYLVRIEGTTVDGATINAWVGHFSIENRYSAGALRPATAGRTLVVDANGLADANTVKVGPTGSGTAQTANDMSGDVDTLITEVGTAGDGLTNINLPNQTMDIIGSITGNLSGSVGSVTGAVGSVAGNVDGSTASVVGAVGSVTGSVGSNADINTTGGAIDVVTLVTTTTTNTDMVGTDNAATASALSTHDGKLDTITTTVGTAGAGLTDLGGMSTTMKGQVNTEVDTALVTTTYGEPGDEVPAATSSLGNKIDYIFKFLRNKVETTSTRVHVYNDAGTNKDHSSTIGDDGTTFTRGEFGAGDA